MECERCEGKGYLETFYHRNTKLNSSLSQCPECKDIAAYSAEVGRRWGKPEEKKPAQPKTEHHGATIIRFPSKKV